MNVFINAISGYELFSKLRVKSLHHNVQTLEGFRKLYNETYKNANFIFELEPNLKIEVTKEIVRADASKLSPDRNNKIVFALLDWWPVKKRHVPPHNVLTNLILDKPNIYVLVAGTDVEDFRKLYTGKSVWDKYFSQIGKKNLTDIRMQRVYSYTLWYTQRSVLRPFNTKPIKKLLLSGAICPLYPERLKLKTMLHPHVVRLDRTRSVAAYSRQLNKYLCCFASCPYDFNQSTLLLKYFEILGSGALLVMPTSHQSMMKKIGLLNNVNAYFIDFSSKVTIDAGIAYLMDDKNRPQIDVMRRAGHDLAKTLFTLENAYSQWLKIMDKIRTSSKT